MQKKYRRFLPLVLTVFLLAGCAEAVSDSSAGGSTSAAASNLGKTKSEIAAQTEESDSSSANSSAAADASEDGAGEETGSGESTTEENTGVESASAETVSSENVNEDLTADDTDPVQDVLSQMTLEEKIYQMFFITPEQLTGVGTATVAGQTTKDSIEKYPVGGIIYFSQNIQSRDQVSSMLDNLQSFSKIDVFTGVDEEGGTVSRIGSNPAMGTTSFPPMYTIGETKDPNKAYQVGYTIGSECTELGFNLDFAPVADVYSNPENTVIGHRAFSSDANTAAEMVAACVRGFTASDMLCTLKHFPGHGDTLTDSHYGAASTNKTLEELRTTEFLPFESGIQAGAEFVMVGHILTPNITDSSTPASLSPDMIAILRNELQFDGIIITDAMNMEAVTDYYSPAKAAVKAIQAGDDMILMPSDFHSAYEGVLDAVESGQITEERIDESVTRILQTKYDSGLLDPEEQQEMGN